MQQEEELSAVDA
ncbi:hypothetical protein CP8484711_0552A, partial [Chlamydia psittaci 84-8471/1]